MSELTEYQQGFSSDEEIDLVPGSVFGFRFFQLYPQSIVVNGGFVSSWTLKGAFGVFWESNVMEAKCMSINLCWCGEGHNGYGHLTHCKPPDPDCECGIYASWTPTEDNPWPHTGNPVLTAVVEATGKTMIGTKGFRTAKAKIVALSLYRNLRTPSHYDEVKVKEVSESIYDCPLYKNSDEMLWKHPLTTDYLPKED